MWPSLLALDQLGEGYLLNVHLCSLGGSSQKVVGFSQGNAPATVNKPGKSPASY